jgi:hypothetical protein
MRVAKIEGQLQSKAAITAIPTVTCCIVRRIFDAGDGGKNVVKLRVLMPSLAGIKTGINVGLEFPNPDCFSPHKIIPLTRTPQSNTSETLSHAIVMKSLL